MRRRVELVRAILHEPRVLLLDEPTTGLDPQSRRALWDAILAVKKRTGATIVLTTHYLEEADTLCDEIAIIDHGEVSVLDSPLALKRAHGGDRLELLLDVPAMRALPRLKGVPHIEASQADDHRLSLRVGQAQKTIPAVLQKLALAHIRVTEMHHRPASLDDVFIQRTGRAPRERKSRPPLRARLWARLRGRGD